MFTQNGAIWTAQQRRREDRVLAISELKHWIVSVFLKDATVRARGQTETEHTFGNGARRTAVP